MFPRTARRSKARRVVASRKCAARRRRKRVRSLDAGVGGAAKAVRHIAGRKTSSRRGGKMNRPTVSRNVVSKPSSLPATCRRPIAIDLFSGCGGLTLGLKQAGFEVVGAIDVDPLAVETYESNHQEVNIRKGELDLLAGCPPCQGFSSIRTLNGGKSIEDPRNDLIWEFLRFVRGLKPKAIMLENVPGLADDERLSSFRDEIAKLGYVPRHTVLDAARFGVPQRRRRLILLAGLGGTIEFASPSPGRRTVRETITNLPPAGKSGDPLHDLSESRGKRVKELIKKIPKNGGSRKALGEREQLDCHKRSGGFKDVYGRMKWSDVSPTITGGCVSPSKGRFLHPTANRAITLREAALLQTFPPDYRFSLRRGKSHAACLIGNALPPEFVKRHAAQVLSYLTEVARSKDQGETS